jgi:Spy/CpxP family protein refolding chaperone
MREGSFLKIIIVCLLILNLGTLGYLWVGRGPGKHDGHPGRPPRENAGQYLQRTLQLTDEQEQQYWKMREAHHRQVVDIHEHMHELQQKLYTSFGSANPIDSNSLLAIADSIAAGQRTIEIITFHHFRELRGMCMPEQQKKFDVVIGEALERLGGPRRGGRPGE